MTKLRIFLVLSGIASLAVMVGSSTAKKATGPMFDSERGLWFEDVDDDGIADVAARASEVEVAGAPYDTDRGLWLIDSDHDGIPDLTEQIGGNDPFDPEDFPGKESLLPVSSAGFPTSSCRSGFTEAGLRLCIDEHEQNATRYDRASEACRERRAHVCTYDDLFYLYYNSTLDASYNPHNNWIGTWNSDDHIFYGSSSITFNGDPDLWNFEGVKNKGETRSYWCCHDRE